MTLLKNDGTVPNKSHNVNIQSWPINRESEGLGLSIKDGWNFGIGFGLAMTIAIPLILLLFTCVIGIGLSIMGSSLGALWP
jgi:hypothetical protein